MKNNYKILMSIQSYFAWQIMNGTKKFEFRKSSIKESDFNKTIYLYSAKVDKAIIGSFKVRKVHQGNCEHILKVTGYDKRPDRNEIIDYYKNTDKCFALELYDVKRFEKTLSLNAMRKAKPNINLPQYYAHIHEKDVIYELLNELEIINNKKDYK